MEPIFIEANLNGTNLEDTNFRSAQCGWTVFANLDLSTVEDLDYVIHRGPNTIGIDTLYKSQNKIPESFLLGCGIPQILIDYLPSLTGKAITFYSCFISYSHRDEEFTKRLHSRLREANLRVWYAPEDIQGGKKLREQIYTAIEYHDKLLLVLSDHSIYSDWVMTEIRRTRKLEKENKQTQTIPYPPDDL